MYREMTDGIEIQVAPSYLFDRSFPDEEFYFFRYQVRIFNHRKDPVTLVRRFWKIRDGNGKVEEIEGPGLLGQTPVINSGDFFEYISYINLKTKTGSMRGYYTTDKGEKIIIPNFFLRTN